MYEHNRVYIHSHPNSIISMPVWYCLHLGSMTFALFRYHSSSTNIVRTPTILFISPHYHPHPNSMMSVIVYLQLMYSHLHPITIKQYPSIVKCLTYSQFIQFIIELDVDVVWALLSFRILEFFSTFFTIVTLVKMTKEEWDKIQPWQG